MAGLCCAGILSPSLSLHAVDLILRQTRRSLDTDGLLLASGLILGRYLQDTVGIDVEGYLNLRNTTTSRSNTCQVELSDTLVLSCHWALTLQNVDGYLGLIISCGRECLALLARNGRVGLDQFGHHTTHGLDTQCQRCHIEQYDIAYATFLVQDGTLDRCTYGYRG